ncbi:MAG TPA: hypothetical protein VGJ81_13485 [Thermoanaerobaculia bacterium]|jgi:hypothetical protein
MRKRLWFVLLLLLIPAVNSYSINKYITDSYYSDATFTTEVAYYEHDCDGTVYSDGTFTNYRYHYEQVCELQGHSEGCQEWDSGQGRWVWVTCPF